MKEYLYSAFKEAENKIPQLKEIPISFDVPKSIEHGDLSSNAAMLLTKILKKNPRVIAQEIIDSLIATRWWDKGDDVLREVEKNYFDVKKFLEINNKAK